MIIITLFEEITWIKLILVIGVLKVSQESALNSTARLRHILELYPKSKQLLGGTFILFSFVMSFWVKGLQAEDWSNQCRRIKWFIVKSVLLLKTRRIIPCLWLAFFAMLWWCIDGMRMCQKLSHPSSFVQLRIPVLYHPSSMWVLCFSWTLTQHIYPFRMNNWLMCSLWFCKLYANASSVEMIVL